MIWHLDESFHIDAKNTAAFEVECELALETQQQYCNEKVLDIEINASLDITISHRVEFDLLRLLPEKFRSSEILKTYLYYAGLQVGEWFSLIKYLPQLVNPNLISIEYLKHLAQLIGVNFPIIDDLSDADIRREVATAIDWYRLKGTYKSLHLLAAIHQFTINLFDFYTNDYTTFIPYPWFAGNEHENPPGLDSSYYKAPHFGAEIVLDRVYTYNDRLYLWTTKNFHNFIEKIEKTRPVHTVPHYSLALSVVADTFQNIIELLNKVTACTRIKLIENLRYFDEAVIHNEWNFDNGIHFDALTSDLLKSITKWKIGDGCFSGDINTIMTGLIHPVLSGNIDPANIQVYADKTTFKFTVPRGETHHNLNELALYIPGAPDKLALCSCFPLIDKDKELDLNVTITIYHKDLSESVGPDIPSSSGSMNS